jgi:hypothetical protein
MIEVIMSTGERPSECQYDPRWGWDPVDYKELERLSKEVHERDGLLSENWTRKCLESLGMFTPTSPIEQEIKSYSEQFLNELYNWHQDNKINSLVEYAHDQFSEGIEEPDPEEMRAQKQYFHTAYLEILEFIEESLGLRLEGMLLRQERETGKDACIKRAMFILGGVSFVGAAHLDAWSFWKIFQRCADDQPTDDIPGEERMKNAVRDLVKKWQNMPDKEFWDVMAANIEAGLVLDGENRSYTIADQIVFITMAKQLFPATEAFNWDSVRDQVENAKVLKTYFDQRYKPSDLYRNVLNVTYKGKPLPRWIAANQVIAALARIAVDNRSRKD